MKKIILSLFVALTATTGSWAQTSDMTMTMTKTGDTYSGTFIMPAYDVEIATELWYRLSQTDDNSALADKTNVFIDRMLNDDGWYTFCAPFETDIPTGWTVKELTGADYNASTKTLSLDFSAAGSIVAGTPYIVQVSETVEDPTFEGISQDWTAKPVTPTGGYVTFVPVLTPTTLTANDRTKLYLGNGNTLFYPSNTMTINSFRAYFQLNGITAGDITQGGNINTFVMNFGGEETRIITIENGRVKSENESWISIDGRKLSDKPKAKGIYVNNGRKIVIK